MFRGFDLARVLTLVAALSCLVPMAQASTSLTPPKGPSWVDGTSLLADMAAPYLARATASDLKPKAVRALKAVQIGQRETFWSMNVMANQPFQLQAVLRKISKHGYYYVQEGYQIDDETLDRMAKQFDEQIYPTNHAYFGSEISPGLDGDPRITLLFLDIVDGWEPGKGYVAGYFFPLDHFSTRLYPYSNEREMFYLDLNPGDPKRSDYLGVLAHEFQHMIHFAADPKEPKWINESLAQLAFFVNGYGHAPQIFSYIRDTDSTFDRFENTLEDYGRSYLFIYYLYSKYGGATDTERQAFVKDLVSSKLQGQASIAELLQKHGVQKPLDQIKADWTLANILNPTNPADPALGYDDSIRFAVQSAKVYETRSLPEDEVKDQVSPDATKYITVTSKVRYLPDHPTMVDKVKICSDAPGNVLWTVNDGQMPPARLIPEGSSTTAENTVSTPLQKDGCGYSATFGPFARLGVVIKKINYRLPDVRGVLSDQLEVPIFSLASVASAKVAPRSFKFSFDGDKKGKFEIKAAQFRADGTAGVSGVTLSSANQGSIDCQLDQGSVTFAIRALSGDKKGVKFSYRISDSQSNEIDSLLAAGSRLASIDPQSLGNVNQDQTARAFYGELLKARESNLTALSSKLSSEPSAGRIAAQRVAAASASEKEVLTGVLKQALRRARFEALDGGKISEELKSSLLSTPSRGDDSDDSHDNIRYLINKKNENIHELTHLKIDPQFIEGQLLQLWKLLELIRGFPHLPLPDGFGIVDYNEQRAKELLAQWAADFGTTYAGAPVPTRRPVREEKDVEKVKSVLRRLILAESLIEFSYNNSLVLAENTAVSIFDFVRLLLAGHKTISDIAAHFENVPIVGPVAKALKKRILGKLIFVGEKFALYVAARLKPPYSTYGPLAVMVIVNVASRVLDVQVDNDNPGFLKDLGVRLFGRYAMVSVPKIGFVARSQPTIDLATEYASNLTANGSLEEAQKKVWDDESSETATSVREVIGENIARKSKLTARERQIASVATRIAQILAYASLLDPTNITKVVSIITGVAAGGVLAHSTWNNASYFFKLPKSDMVNGVRWAYDPAAAASVTSTDLPLRRSKLSATYNNKILGELKSSYESYQLVAGELMAMAQAKTLDAKGLEAKVEALMKADAKIDMIASKVETLALSGGALSERGEADALDLYKAAQAELMRRTEILSDAFVRVAGARPGNSTALDNGPGAYLATLKKSLDTWAASSEDAAIAAVVSRSDLVKKGKELIVFGVVSNLSRETIRKIDVKLVSGLDFSILDGQIVKHIDRLDAGDERQVAWRIKLNEAKPILAPQLAIVAEAEGVNILPKFQGLQ